MQISQMPTGKGGAVSQKHMDLVKANQVIRDTPQGNLGSLEKADVNGHGVGNIGVKKATEHGSRGTKEF